MATYSLRKDIPTSAKNTLAEYPELLQRLLFYRGIKTKKDAEAFLHPDYDNHLHDPFLLKDMDKAVKRILQAIQQNEKIVIYSDYDCDGIPGGVLLHDFFKKIKYKNFENYIPHRHEEGYGLNISALEKAAENNTKVLITVDCGITDVVPVECANKHGIDVIITDHHLPHEKLPPAHAIVNPKQEDCSYPFDGLCGAGVAFKLVQGLLQKGNFEVRDGWEKWLLDMAGLATIADRMPLIGENRAIAYFGIKVLRKSRRSGLQQLCRIMRVPQYAITEDDIGFMIAPRINAASRMDKPKDAFRLLASADVVEAGELAKKLHKINDVRKGIVASMTKEIKKRISERETLGDIIVMGNPNWKPSLLGLAANSVVEEYDRPVFLWGRDGGDVLKGSCRAPVGINIVELMGNATAHFIDYGGHVGAGGFSVSHEHIHTLEEALIKAYAEIPPKEESTQENYLDATLSLEEVNGQTQKIIEQLAPFGEGNPKPLFLLKDIIIEAVELFGKSKDHLRLIFLKQSGEKVSAIGFFMKPEQFSKELKQGATIDLVATLEKSFFLNKPEIRLRIVDVI